MEKYYNINQCPNKFCATKLKSLIINNKEKMIKCKIVIERAENRLNNVRRIDLVEKEMHTIRLQNKAIERLQMWNDRFYQIIRNKEWNGSK